jgi:hypothetical protein
MNGITFAQYIRKRTKTDVYTFPDDDIKAYANAKKDEIAEAILEANEDYFGIFGYRTTYAGIRNYSFEQEYLNHLKRVEIKLTKDSNYVVCDEYDMNTLRIPSDNVGITQYMKGRSKPGYDIFGGELILLSGNDIEDVEDGIKMTYFIYPQDITDLTSTRDLSLPKNAINFGLPKSFHILLADMIVKLYKEDQEKPIPLDDTDKSVLTRFNTAIARLRGQNLDRADKVVDVYNDGSQY